MIDIIAKMQAALDEKKKTLRKRRAAMKVHAAKLQALFADVEPLGCDPYTDGDWIFVSLTGDKHKFLQFCRAMRKHGFEVPKVEKGATGFQKLNYIGEGDNALALYFIFSSSVCRRVKVGTKMVEQDVFEVVCDELMPYGEQHPAAEPVNDLPF
jgi:hypothetical protein